MCGIVGLFLKDPKLEPDLGALMSPMLGILCDRGPDSAGFAVFGQEPPAASSSRYAAQATDFEAVARRLSETLGFRVTAIGRDTHGILTMPVGCQAEVRAALKKVAPELAFVGAGQRMELYKEVGRPDLVAARFGLERMSGTHRWAHPDGDGSAVTTDGAIHFSTGLDQCLVHNGSLSNHNAVRRELSRDGLSFATENDSEVAAGYLTARMRKGASLRQALTDALTDLDGFYTFVVGTESGFGVLRDPIACKPAVMAETDRYVAFGTEYRALVDLPGIENAKIWEPEPATVYFWGASELTARDKAEIVDLAATELRQLNDQLHKLRPDTNLTLWRIRNPRGRHSVAVGMDAPVTIEIDGHVGYYCAGMNKRATVIVNGNAGVGVAENIMSGTVHVKGDASQSAGATGCGGLLIIDGNASARCGISMKGVDIVVKGSVGHMSAFMAQAGSLVVLGDAGESLGDSIYEARLYVRGKVQGLGADCIEKPMTDHHKAKLAAKLEAAGVTGIGVDAFKRYGSARRLYHFHVDNVY